MHERWIADRMRAIEVSGIRKIFDLAAKLEDPVNLSIGQPDFPIPAPIKQAANTPQICEISVMPRMNRSMRRPLAGATIGGPTR